jgi:hypothetical protein
MRPSSVARACTAATEAEDNPAAQVLRNFMRSYLKQLERRAFEADARRQSRAISKRTKDPKSDEYAVMREIEADLDRDDFAGGWKA